MKRCRECDHLKEVTKFYPCRTATDGRANICIKCDLTRQRVLRIPQMNWRSKLLQTWGRI